MEIKFKRDTTFRKLLFSPDSFSHPAKMDAQLLLWITERYTKPGETILDPMAGSGTTMLACMLNRNVVLVELEEKFCKMCQDNWELVKMKPQLGVEMGDCQIIQGDARNLEGLLADSIITSPPYSDSPTGGGLNIKPPRPGTSDQSGRSPGSPSQLGAGKYDKIVTSPPYAEAQSPAHTKEGEELRLKIARERGVSPDKVSFLDYTKGQVDKVVTSPPYEGMKQDDKRARDPKQIDKRAREFEKAGGDFHTPGRLRTIAQHYAGYAEDKENIGNLKSTSYLEAMLQVYRQCYKVLKPGGLAIIVTKNFIREKKVIRLDIDTIKLCEKAGFSFIERHFRKLPGQSFWRITYQKKYPDVETLDNEEVMIFQKPQKAPEGF